MTLAEGIGDNLPFSKLYASHCASIDAILKYGTKTQKEITCLDSVAGIFTPFSVQSGLKMNEDDLINGKINIQGKGRRKVWRVFRKDCLRTNRSGNPWLRC